MYSRNRLFIGIAVKSPEGMKSLPGIHQVMARMADYARQNPKYDDPIILTDQKDPVTSDLIIKLLPEDLLLERPRITVYFCGHGAYSEGTEIWYLSRGRSHWRERVDVLAFRDVLTTYAPEQVTMFSDACQVPDSHPTKFSPILDEYSGSRTQTDYDTFRATCRGQPAFAAPNGEPLFSNLLTQALSAKPPRAAFDTIDLQERGRRVVTSQSLRTFIADKLPDAAALIGKEQYPDLTPTYIYPNNDYLDLGAELSGLGFGPVTSSSDAKPAPNVEDPRTRDAAHLHLILNASASDLRREFWENGAESARKFNVAEDLFVSVNGGGRDDTPIRLFVGDGQPRHSIDPANGFVRFALGATARQSTMTLQSGDLYIPLPQSAKSGPLAVQLLTGAGDGGLAPGAWSVAWYPTETPSQVSELNPMRLFEAFLKGTLPTGAIKSIAGDLSGMPHADPLLGVIAAHLLDRIGDIAAIRRLCRFFVQRADAVPFDIALLARLTMRWSHRGYRIDLPEVPRDERGDAAGLPDLVWQQAGAVAEVPVAGIVPLLRAGWSRLGTLTDPGFASRRFLELDEALTGAPIATLGGHAAGKRFLTLMQHLFEERK
ncbi:hypothetical protein [Amaricoccus solimangrovi]|uniref:Caspase family protein n=1 Tax=Amaricoccus solimangrovi TaxID=2589815 RepID=A0A501WIE6_9RHOB|nr:hypothetical protein [Amaricoccus solimangrovi]TPE47874.1 hypothetical protein FJM51_19245 [Amaricoccus solimangrovi]